MIDPQEKLSFENYNILNENLSNLNVEYSTYKEQTQLEIKNLSEDITAKSQEIDKITTELLNLSQSFEDVSEKQQTLELDLENKNKDIEKLKKIKKF